MTEEKEYGMFNGRRNADNYVKAWLKGVTWICGICLTIGLTFSGWLTIKIYDHETRLVKIEANRFTSNDAVRMVDGLREELLAIRGEIAKLPKEAPPIWFKEAVAQNTKDIREMQRVLRHDSYIPN